MTSRVVYLLRHGQYETESIGVLTPLGRRQAVAAARFLGHERFATVWSSTLPRARETADIVARELGIGPVRPTRILREGMFTKVEGYPVPASEREEDRDRAAAAWEKFFRPSRVDRKDLLVCHGNLIRYFVCRALDAPIGKWVRMNTNHCALTRIVVRGTGAVRVVSYNETSHLPRRLVT
ncbi:MAG TPA: histidine phosphatase family protein [Labilithrix sp.]